MKNRLFQRILMLAAGLTAAAVILLSQSYYHGEVQTKAKTEQSAGQEKHAFISAPSDLLPGSGLLQLHLSAPSLLSVISLPEIKTSFLPFALPAPNSFFRILFRTIISAKAP